MVATEQIDKLKIKQKDISQLMVHRGTNFGLVIGPGARLSDCFGWWAVQGLNL